MMMATTTIQPPTSYLPPITKIAACTTTQLLESIQYLHSLYRPQVRGSRRRRCREVLPDGGDDSEAVRSDVFERAYAIRWLTTLIAQSEAQTPTPTPESDLLIDDTDGLVHQAASLLAICAGVAAAGRVQRRFTFESTLVGKIHVDLMDIPLDNHDYGSVGAQTWGGACVLAEMIAEHPDRFGLATCSPSSALHDSPHPFRILELGAGTGLVGLTVAKLLHALSLLKNSDPKLPFHARATTVVLTDFYPPVLANLKSNIRANFSTVPGDTQPEILVDSHPLDWSSFSTTEAIPDVLSAPFDVIFGADIIYEARHAVWICDCLKSLLAYPDGSNRDPVFHLVIPLRPTHTFESSTVEEVFGPKNCVFEVSKPRLTILSKESIVCEAYGDSVEKSFVDDDVEYVYYQIGWT